MTLSSRPCPEIWLLTASTASQLSSWEGSPGWDGQKGGRIEVLVGFIYVKLRKHLFYVSTCACKNQSKTFGKYHVVHKYVPLCHNVGQHYHEAFFQQQGHCLSDHLCVLESFSTPVLLFSSTLGVVRTDAGDHGEIAAAGERNPGC